MRASAVRDMAVAIAGAAVFLWLALATAGGVNPSFDSVIRDAVHAWAPPGLTRAIKTITWFGSGWLLYPAGAAIVVALARRNRRREAVFFAIAVAGAATLERVMKVWFHRPRPEPFFGYPMPGTYSFPSGHAFLSFAFYVALAEIVTWERRPAEKVLCWMAALFMTLAIGLSRIYLGVHYPSDVIAGYAGALVWVSAVRLGVRVK